MPDLFDPAQRQEIHARLERLFPDSPGQRGKMAPHTLLGRLRGAERGCLMHDHLDRHPRQLGA
jgi:hypothetical protein